MGRWEDWQIKNTLNHPINLPIWQSGNPPMHGSASILLSRNHTDAAVALEDRVFDLLESFEAVFLPPCLEDLRQRHTLTFRPRLEELAVLDDDDRKTTQGSAEGGPGDFDLRQRQIE